MPSTWTRNGNSVIWQSDCLTGGLDVTRPSDGLADLQIAGKPHPAAWLLRTHSPSLDGGSSKSVLEDSYIRGGDLVVTETFPQPGNEPEMRRQTYWRLLDAGELCGAAAGIDLIVSVNTGLLDARPRTIVSSSLPAMAGWQCRADSSEFEPLSASAAPATTFLVQLADVPFAIAQMIHSTDLTQCRATLGVSANEGIGVIEQQLFGETLEKGVILRGRIRVLLVASDEAQDVTLASRARFEKAPLPLTT